MKLIGLEKAGFPSLDSQAKGLIANIPNSKHINIAYSVEASLMKIYCIYFCMSFISSSESTSILLFKYWLIIFFPMKLPDFLIASNGEIYFFQATYPKNLAILAGFLFELPHLILYISRFYGLIGTPHGESIISFLIY
jgi:hypothetical protein